MNRWVAWGLAAATACGCSGGTGTPSAGTPPPVAAPATSPTTAPPPAAPPAASTPPSATPPASEPPPGTAPAPTPSPPPQATPPWAGTRTFSDPWTELGQLALLPGGGALVAGNEFTYAPDGSGARHGALAWVDGSGAVQRDLQVMRADEIFGLALAASGAVAIGGYTQGEGGYLAVLDAAGSVAWRLPVAPAVPRGLAFAAGGDLVVCGWDGGAYVERRAPDGTLRWRTPVAVDSDGFSFGVAISPSGEIAAAGGRDTTAVARLGPDGALRWTWSLPLGSAASSVGGVAIDLDGSVVVVGHTVRPPPGLAPGGGDDAFVVRLDPAGRLAWARAVATPGVDLATAVALDPEGGAVVAGARALDSSGNGRAFVARWDRDGAAGWTTDLDLPGNDVPAAVALDAGGDAWVAGAFPALASGFGKTGFLARLDPAGHVR